MTLSKFLTFIIYHNNLSWIMPFNQFSCFLKLFDYVVTYTMKYNFLICQ